MFIVGIGTAAPERRYRQEEGWEAVQRWQDFSKLSLRSRAILKKVLLGDNGIASRHLALDSLDESFNLIPDALHQRFVRNAPQLATDAAQRALSDAAVAVSEIDALIVSTCTGYLCPGLTSYVSERLGLRPDASLLDLVGQGCGAAIPNLRTAEALLAGGRAHRVLCVCVEVCSAAFYIDDDPGVLISACLFGDGAGAVVASCEPPRQGRAVRWMETHSLLSPADRDYLKFESRGGMLRNILGRQVPTLAAKHAEAVLSEVLSKSGVSRGEITAWILHAAGRDVLSALRNRLGLAAGDLVWSEGILSEYGNISSPSVFFVLDAALSGGAPAGRWWMSSFGAGFSCHGAMLDVSA